MRHPIPAAERLIVALDVDNAADALAIVRDLGDAARHYKVGLQLFLAEGFPLVERIMGMGHRLMLDLKFLDIPQTTHLAMREAAKRGVHMATIHSHVSSVCRAAVAGAADGDTLVLGVTVMTSYGETERAELGYPGSIEDLVLARASLALAAGCGGVVASAREAALIRHAYGAGFVIVTPGIRPAGLGTKDDQHRIMTPGRAIAGGSDYLVVGRPITRADDSRAAALAIQEEIAEALEGLEGRDR
ncbi:Orotidine 5'-phosphate decarboxylase [Fundidesulfovibrio magnetotacticus]|uniref:Orotidine 5'-phosphate decarboxylase n=1 Tax=Fundidesulfovibrio magnetotacticus TaxID=2730080 RepID=A0A6V8LYB0_9BACT|nr:orotidine-5'-phosphate decarboxylase [Fundidesulfovibrio magnetotacticus]GFK94796.1 Orotidine 5'-phosphate decarboxylase [Fundidesulfovibrio magnetotacticus]